VTCLFEHRLDALQRIYDIYDQVLASYALACRWGCDACCTANVTLTTLEALGIADGLGDAAEEVLARLTASPDPRRFRPQTSINTVAAMVLGGQEPPEEGADAEAGPCPLLRGRCCPIYPLRPFACRCMVSARPCDVAGYATIDDFLVSVNTVFQQTIEDLDAAGATGNLSDLLPLLCRDEFREPYGSGGLDPAALKLAANRRMPALMVPPEHRGRMAPIVERLRKAIRVRREA
jgi:hypothetical protein